MVTTRGSEKAQKPSKSSTKQSKKSLKDATLPAVVDGLSPTSQERSLTAAASPKSTTIGKRKRATGRKALNVGSRCVHLLHNILTAKGTVQSSHTDAALFSIPSTNEQGTEARASYDLKPVLDQHSLTSFLAHVREHSGCKLHPGGDEVFLDIKNLVEEKCPPPISDESLVNFNPSAVLCSLKCRTNSCNRVFCLGCGTELGPTRHSIFGCDRGWYVALWLQLVYFILPDIKKQRERTEGQQKLQHELDQQELKELRGSKNAVVSKKDKTGTSKGLQSHPKANEPAKPSQAITGTGYASGSSTEGQDKFVHAEARARNRQRAEDIRNAHTLSLVVELLQHMPENSPWTEQSGTESRPNKARKTTRSSSPGQSTIRDSDDTILLSTFFHWSGLLKYITQLFRNDSLEEATSRQELYNAAIDFVDILLNSSRTSQLVTARTSGGLDMHSSLPSNMIPSLPQHVLEVELEEDGQSSHASIRESLTNILLACDSIKASAAKMPKVYRDKQSKKMLGLTDRLLALGQRLELDVAKLSHKSVSEEILPQATPSTERFYLVEEAEITSMYTRKKDADIKSSGTSGNARMRTLFKELSLLRTGLPEGMFLKMANSRPDISKALIIGPAGTPYEGGLFEFDILCPKEYPQSPPKVDCATASRLEARPFSLNPNLYNNGYVCLSVINTWHGAKNEQWLPGKSTMLQVLLSIQSMVLGTATPADNEPGGLGVTHDDYNRNVQVGTVCAGLLPWLQASDLKNGIWKDCLHAYFKANAGRLLDTVRGWSKDNKRIKEYNPSRYPFIPVPIPEQLPVEDHQGFLLPPTEDSAPTGSEQAGPLDAPLFPLPPPSAATFNDALTTPNMTLGSMPSMTEWSHNGQEAGAKSTPNSKARGTDPKARNLLKELEKALKEYT